MPVSKHRKKTESKGKKKRYIEDNTVRKDRPIRISKHKFPHLRDNPDFRTLIKVGRLVNAVAFGMQTVIDYADNSSPVGKRQYNRAIFMTGGYLFEGIRLVESLRLKYVNEKSFSDLNVILGEEYKLDRKVLKEMRDCVAFHLDSDDRSTKAALKKLDLPHYDLMSGETDKILDFYFNFADEVDLNYLIDVFSKDRTEAEAVSLIFGAVTRLMSVFPIAGHKFLMGLGEKMKAWKYTE